MASQKTKFTLWLIASLTLLTLVNGCGGTVVSLGFPLSNGNTWTYQGTLKFKMGQQEQTMPPLTFQLLCRQLGGKPKFPFEVDFMEEDARVWRAQVATGPKGLWNPISGEIWLPLAVKTGKAWPIHVNGVRYTVAVKSQTSVTVPAGTFPAYLIDFRRDRKSRGTLWLDPDLGIVAVHWASRTPTGIEIAHLELSSYTLP